MFRSVFLSLCAAGLLLPATATFAGHPEPTPTITGIVAASGGEFDRNRNDFDILLNAVLAADLAGALDAEDADLTVLAPNDRAFIRLARDLGYHGGKEAEAFDTIVSALTALGDGDPIPLLRDILLYHVSPGAQTRHELVRNTEVETLLAEASVFIRKRQLVDGEPELRNPRFIGTPDIAASNGLIQVINRVLIPLDIDNSAPELGTITDIVAASGGDFDHNFRDFDILLNAVLAAGLDGALADTTTDLTVFAPNDLAFVRLARLLGYRGIDEAGSFDAIVAALTELGEGDPIPVLTNVLLYHVSPGSQSLNSVLGSDELATLLIDADLEVDGFRLVDADDGARDPRLLPGRSDIRAANGIVHSINRVLLPVEVTAAPAH